MNIITGYTGEPHITSAQDRDGNQGSYGAESYILNVGSKMEATIESVNEIRIADGALCHQGCLGNIDAGMYEAVAISNGSQGMKRSDLIVCRYEKDSETNVESLSLVVIEGTPDASTPTDPAYNSGYIQQGDSPVDFPLYRVNINGVNITSITQMAPNVRTQAEIDDFLGDTDISSIGNGTVTGALNTLKDKFTYQDTSTTTGTTAYDGRYYNNFDIPTNLGTLVGMFIYGVSDNKSAYAIRINDSTGRVYSHSQSLTVYIRMLFMA